MPTRLGTRTGLRRFGGLALTLVFSIGWTAYQMLLHESQYSYINYSKAICEYLTLPLAGTEAQRLITSLAYFQSLPHILLAYCLLVKWAPRNNGAFLRRCGAVAAVFILSLIAVPGIGTTLFPSLRSGMVGINNGYMTILLVCIGAGTVGVAGLFLFKCLNGLRYILAPRAALRAVGRYGLILVLSFLMAVLYGFALGVLANFNDAAANGVVRTFMPDANLYSGVLCMGVMAPIVEELGYRGLMLTKLKKYLPVWAAVIISSALFAVWHRNLGQIVATFPMGLLFAAVYLRTGKLRFSILLHTLSNTLMTLSMANSTSLVPYIQPLTQMRMVLLDVSLPIGVLGILVLTTVIALLLWKGFDLCKE